MKTISIFAAILATVLCAQLAAAESPTDRTAKGQPSSSAAAGLGFGSHDSNAPIDISSNSFDYDLNAKVGVYRGNVLAVQGDMRLRADSMKVNVAQGKPTRIEAAGRVVVNAPNGTATGDNGIYELGPRTITMTGHVVLTKEKNVMRGTKLVMDLNSNLAHMYAEGMPGGRVQGLFVPAPQKDSGQTAGHTKKPGRASNSAGDTSKASNASEKK